MNITEVKIRKIFKDDGNMRAIVSVTFDNMFALHDLKVVRRKNDDLFVAMPSATRYDKVTKQRTYSDIFHPIDVESRRLLENAVLDAYNRALESEATHSDDK